MGLQKGSWMGPPAGVPGSSPQTDDCAELVPVLGYLSTDRLALPLSPGLLPLPTLLKESLRARFPSRAWVLPGLSACLDNDQVGPLP